MAIVELEQVWNSGVAVAITVATIDVAILEHCDLQFPNLKKKWHKRESHQLRSKTEKNQGSNRIPEQNSRLSQLKKFAESIGIHSFSFFSYLLVIY